MTEREVEHLVRQLIYKMTVQEAIDCLYEIINKKKLVHHEPKPSVPVVKEKAFGVIKDAKYRDARGELIYFPNDERPYYDKALQKTFHSKKEKCEYMREKGFIMDGSDDKTNKPLEAGDNRWSKVK